MVAWGLNSVLNGMILLLFLRFYVKVHLIKKKARAVMGEFKDSASEIKKAS